MLIVKNGIRKQTGSVLFISLMMLLLLTIIGLAGMSNSLTELKISNNLKERSIAFQFAQSGIDATMCLSVTSDNPFDLDLQLTDISENPASQFVWDKTYDNFNKDPFSGVTNTTCSVSGGIVGGIPASDLLVALRQTAKKVQCPRERDGSSYGVIECNNYVIDSRYYFGGSGANVVTWAGASRQVPGS